MIGEPRGAFMCQSSTLVVLIDCEPFHGLLCTFWGSRENFRIYELRGVITCRSLTLKILAHSGKFRGLLLSVLVSQSDFHN